MPVVNFIASYSMANNLGAKIYLADVDPITGQMTPKTLLNCIKKNDKFKTENSPKFSNISQFSKLLIFKSPLA